MHQSARLPEAWNGCPRCRGIDAHLPWNTQSQPRPAKTCLKAAGFHPRSWVIPTRVSQAGITITPSECRPHVLWQRPCRSPRGGARHCSTDAAGRCLPPPNHHKSLVCHKRSPSTACGCLVPVLDIRRIPLRTAAQGRKFARRRLDTARCDLGYIFPGDRDPFLQDIAVRLLALFPFQSSATVILVRFSSQ